MDYVEKKGELYLPAAGLTVVLCPEFLQNDLGIYILMTNGPEPV